MVAEVDSTTVIEFKHNLFEKIRGKHPEIAARVHRMCATLASQVSIT